MVFLSRAFPKGLRDVVVTTSGILTGIDKIKNSVNPDTSKGDSQGGSKHKGKSPPKEGSTQNSQG